MAVKGLTGLSSQIDNTVEATTPNVSYYYFFRYSPGSRIIEDKYGAQQYPLSTVFYSTVSDRVCNVMRTTSMIAALHLALCLPGVFLVWRRWQVRGGTLKASFMNSKT